MILKQLDMIETTLGQRGREPRRTRSKSPGAIELDRGTLRELFRFFTDRIGVHFRREAVLVRALARVLDSKHEGENQFEGLLNEHRLLQADAAGVVRKLKVKSDSKSPNEGNPYGIRSFVKHCRGHLACEEQVLYVLADMRLSEQQKRAVSRRMLQV